MGFRDNLSKPGGGGRLNNVGGTITAYEFSTVFPYKAADGSRAKPLASGFKSLFCNLSIRADGATEATVEPVFCGDARQWVIAEDGQSVSPNADSENTPRFFGAVVVLLESMFKADFPELEGEAGEPIDFTPLVNQRFQFVQVKDESAKNKQKGKGANAGKEFDRKVLAVTAYHGEAEAQPTPRTAAKAAFTGKATSTAARGGKTNGASKPSAGEAELVAYADSVLIDLLADAPDNTIAKDKLAGLVTRKLLGNPQRPAVQKLIASPEYQARDNGWTTDAKTIALA